MFKRHQDQPTQWTWRVLGGDGRVEQQGGSFEIYEMAVQNAIHNGFHPMEDHWIVENAHEIAHHERGQKPLVILKQNPTTIPPGTVFATNPGSSGSEEYSSPSSGPTQPES
jgi:hypothetical protein